MNHYRHLLTGPASHDDLQSLAVVLFDQNSVELLRNDVDHHCSLSLAMGYGRRCCIKREKQGGESVNL